MIAFSNNYPNIYQYIIGLENFEDTFLYDYLSSHDYQFWQDLEYFLTIKNRLKHYQSILNRLSVLAPMSMEINKAWNNWRTFRAAQSEVTSIFLIENLFLGRVLEIVPESRTKTPDLMVMLDDQERAIEVKTQSGQQHGDVHPRAKGVCLFDPKDEDDLRSWLFEEKQSSRNHKPMKPKVVEAEEKGAHILMAMTDIFPMINDIKFQVSSICPKNRLVGTETIQIQEGKPLTVYFFQADFPISQKLHSLKEIWLFDDSNLNRFIVLSQAMYLLKHLRKS